VKSRTSRKGESSQPIFGIFFLVLMNSASIAFFCSQSLFFHFLFLLPQKLQVAAVKVSSNDGFFHNYAPIFIGFSHTAPRPPALKADPFHFLFFSPSSIGVFPVVVLDGNARNIVGFGSFSYVVTPSAIDFLAVDSSILVCFPLPSSFILVFFFGYQNFRG